MKSLKKIGFFSFEANIIETIRDRKDVLNETQNTF